MIFNNVCYHCGAPLIAGHWKRNVFRTEEYRTPEDGAQMFFCPTCKVGWEVLHTNSGLAYPSFMVDGHEWRGPINQRSVVQSSKEPPMTSRWIPVQEDGTAKATPFYVNTACEAIFSLRIICVCGQSHHFESRGGSPVWVCEDCGRVYRATATFAVEEHVGDGR